MQVHGQHVCERQEVCGDDFTRTVRVVVDAVVMESFQCKGAGGTASAVTTNVNSGGVDGAYYVDELRELAYDFAKDGFGHGGTTCDYANH
jgi:hypothetical protein